MIDTLAAGQTISCTVKKTPVAVDDRQTILRLMRKDPSSVRSLRRAQMLRRRNMVVYNRGNRDWYLRRPTAKVVTLKPGAQWTMRINLDLVRDLKAVASFLDIKKA